MSAGDFRDSLAVDIRATLAEYDDPMKPIVWLVRDVVAKARELDQAKASFLHAILNKHRSPE